MKQAKDFRILLVYPNLTMMLVPSVAIAIFTGILKKAGYTVDLFDTTHYSSNIAVNMENRVEYLQARPFDTEKDLGVTIKTDITGDFVRKVNEFRPDLLVVSVVEDTFLQAVALLDEVKDAGIPSVVGGVFVTAAPDSAISFPQVNMIGLGEGEGTVLDVAERIRKGETCEDVPNLWVKRPDGTIIKNRMRPLIDINKPLPDYSLFDQARFYRPMGGRIFKTVPIETYRGCPYTCTFCNSPMQVEVMRENDLGYFLRRKRINVVRDEIQHLIELYDPEYFYFVDDSFLARPEAEIQEFVEMYREFQIPFWFNTRPENASAERLSALKEVNCDRITFGLECGNEEFRQKVIRRAPSNDEIVSSFDIIARSKIAFSVNNIIGFPDETRDMIFDTIELNRQLWGYDALTCSIFTPYHGTELRKVAVEHGYLSDDVVTQSHISGSSLLDMPQLTSKEIDSLVRTFSLYVRFPKEDWTEIEKSEHDTPDGNKVFQEFQETYRKRFFSGTQVDILGDWEEPQGYAVRPQDSPTD